MTEHATHKHRQTRPGYDLATRSKFACKPHPPSVVRLADLSQNSLRDLRLETHHRGKVLIIRTFFEAIQSAWVKTGIEDEHLQIERLTIYDLPFSIDGNVFFPEGSILTIKEPYYTLLPERSAVVRVDHPTDLVILDPQDTSIPLALHPRVSNAETITVQDLAEQAADVPGDRRSTAKRDKSAHKHWQSAQRQIPNFDSAFCEIGHSQT